MAEALFYFFWEGAMSIGRKRAKKLNTIMQLAIDVNKICTSCTRRINNDFNILLVQL